MAATAMPQFNIPLLHHWSTLYHCLPLWIWAWRSEAWERGGMESGAQLDLNYCCAVSNSSTRWAQMYHYNTGSKARAGVRQQDCCHHKRRLQSSVFRYECVIKSALKVKMGLDVSDGGGYCLHRFRSDWRRWQRWGGGLDQTEQTSMLSVGSVSHSFDTQK